MFEVIKYFTDLEDENYAYHVGDKYPREGVEPTEERINALKGKKNVRKVPLIKEVKQTKKKGK